METITGARRGHVTLDGNEAAARVAYRLSDVIAIYPITPSSPMGEWAGQWATQGIPNLWSMVPTIAEVQGDGVPQGRCTAPFRPVHSRPRSPPRRARS